MNNSRQIIRQTIERSNKPLNKYNTAMHENTAELVDFPNDRTGYDCGMEMEIKSNEQ